MSSRTKERIYLVVTAFCLILCAVLLLSVLLDKPVFGGPVGEHVPVLRISHEATNSTELPKESTESLALDGCTLTDKQITNLLSSYLPEPFCDGRVAVEIGENGTICFLCRMERSALIEWLKSTGSTMTFRQSIALRLLPKKFDIELCLNVTGREGKIALTPQSLLINEEEIALDGLPAGVLAVAENAVNAALQAEGCSFTTLEFTDGAIILR